MGKLQAGRGVAALLKYSLLIIALADGAPIRRYQSLGGRAKARASHFVKAAAATAGEGHLQEGQLQDLGSSGNLHAADGDIVGWADRYSPSAFEQFDAAYHDTCGVIARAVGIPKVALLFLTVSDLPHDEMWQRWLAEAAGRVPVDALLPGCHRENDARPEVYTRVSGLTSKLLSRQSHTEAALLCKALVNDNATPAYYRQLLFSVFAHAPPTVLEFAPGTLLYGQRVPERVPSVRLSHTLVQVERFMLRHALKDELNQRFIFMSESQVPVYPAVVVYQQLMHEPKARIDACEPSTLELESEKNGTNALSFWRWKPELSEKSKWRKTSHWISMTRQVAEVVVHEREVDEKFLKHCTTSCSNIEHYIPTMLATHNLTHLTSCSRGTTYVDWTKFDSHGHPHTFKSGEINMDTYRKARKANSCTSDRWAAKVSAETSMVPFDLLQKNYCSAVVEPAVATGYQPMGVHCNMFIRKVAAEAAEAVLREQKTLGERAGYEDQPAA